MVRVCRERLAPRIDRAARTRITHEAPSSPRRAFAHRARPRRHHPPAAGDVDAATPATDGRATACQGARVGQHENDPPPAGPWRSHSRSVSSLPAMQVTLEDLTGSPSSRSWRSPHSQPHQPPARILGFARTTFSKLATSKERPSRTCVVWHWEAAYRSLNSSSLPMRIFCLAGTPPSPIRRFPDDSVIRARNFGLLFPNKWNSIVNLAPSESTLRGSRFPVQRSQPTARNFSMR